MTTAPHKRYNEYALGETIEDVLIAFYAHPGVADQRPFGHDVHQGFEFFLSPQDRCLYRLMPNKLGVAPLTPAQEATMIDNLKGGAVELYLRRPSARVVGQQERTMLHAATGRPLLG